MDVYSTQSLKIKIETYNAYQYRIVKLDFCFYKFHIFDFCDMVKGRLMCIVLCPSIVTTGYRMVTMHEVDA